MPGSGSLRTDPFDGSRIIAVAAPAPLQLPPMATAALSRPRHATLTVDIAGVRVGGEAPIVVQSMTNTDTADVAATVRQVRELAEAGSELVRITVNTDEAAAAVAPIRDRAGGAGLHGAADRRLSFQRPQAAEGPSRLRRGTGQIPHQSGQRGSRRQARPAVRRNDRNRLPATASRCASASTGAASIRICWRD